MHRVLFAVYRKKGLSTEEFLSHYRDVHVPIAQRFAKLRKYEIFPIPAAGAEDDGGGPDAFAVMTFDYAADFEAVLASHEIAEAVADNENFVDHFDTYVVDQSRSSAPERRGRERPRAPAPLPTSPSTAGCLRRPRRPERRAGCGRSPPGSSVHPRPRPRFARRGR
jgi:uncharacterized protein (TIGR02118 family)